MSAMTIRADRSLQVASLCRSRMHAVLRFIIVIRMAFLAGLIVSLGKLTLTAVGQLRMWVSGNIRMTGFTFDPYLAMD